MNLNEKYSNIVSSLERISKEYCRDKKISLIINVPDEDKINAGVKKTGDCEYTISIFPGCLNLDYQIENITEKYNNDDLNSFFRFTDLAIFERHEEDTYREELNNLFATVIILHIFWHEIGHIEAGYADRERDYVEFDSDRIGNYSMQEQEMVADWLSTKQVFYLFFNVAIQNSVSDNEVLVKAIQQFIILYWISLTIEFQIFDEKYKSVVDFSSLNHPYPAVRLMYSIEAMGEAIVDVMNCYGLNDDEAEKAMRVIVDDIYVLIQSFMQITKSPIDIKKDDKKIIECYKYLRDLPYSDEYVKNDFLHLEPLAESYRDGINRFLGVE